MQELSKQLLDERLCAVIGMRLASSHRAADLEAFQIGNLREVIGKHGKHSEIGDFALHLQCPWRIRAGDRIAVAYRDLEYPRSEATDEDFDPNELGATRREELLERLFKEWAGTTTIEACFASTIGDLRVELSGGYVLEAFPDTSDGEDDREYWRLIKHGAWHLVASGHGIRVLD